MASKYAPLESKEEIRIVILGKTGVGKSESANTIFGKDHFYSMLSPSTVTLECQKETTEFDGQDVSVIDTPGLCDTSKTKVKMIREVARCISFAAPGPHVFLIVLQLNRFTKEEQDTMNFIQTIFGREASRYTIALFTRGDDLKRQGMPIERFIKSNDNLQHFINQCGGGYHVFDNTDSDRHQVRELLGKIMSMVQRNGESYYTTASKDMFQEAERAIREEAERLMREDPDMDSREARRSAERDNMFIKGVTAAALAVIGAAAGAGIEIGVGAALGGVVAGPFGAALGVTVGLAVAGLGIVVKKKACTIQ